MRTSPFTEEHEALRGTVRRFVADELAPHSDVWERDGWFDSAIFPRMGELGLLGLCGPEEHGGAGADYWANVVLHEELARWGNGAVPMAVGVQTDMATPPILKFGTDQQRREYLEPAVRGEKIGAIGITEPEAGSDVRAVATRARRDGADWVIDGSKVFITNGVRADFVTMVVRTDEPDAADPWAGISLFLVDTDLDGFVVESTLDKVGMRASDTALLHLDGVRVPDQALLGEPGRGFAQVMWELQGERLVGAIGAVAGAALALEGAATYASQREAFGRPISRFQVQRHRLVGMATEIEGVRALVYDACDAWNRGEYATTEIAMAKLAAAQMSFRVADEALQLHGGYGYSREFDVERAWRDARLLRIGGGTDEVQREIIAKLIGA